MLRLMDEARGEGLKLAVCSAATKSSVVFVVEQLLGVERYRVRIPACVCLCTGTVHAQSIPQLCEKVSRARSQQAHRRHQAT